MHVIRVTYVCNRSNICVIVMPCKACMSIPVWLIALTHGKHYVLRKLSGGRQGLLMIKMAHGEQQVK